MSQNIIPFREQSQTIRYDEMCRAIAAAYSIDEVREMKNQATAIQQYQRMAHNTEAERQACEIRLRAERRLGELLREMEKAKGSAQPGVGRAGMPSQADRALGETTLAGLGISYNESSRAQRLADVPECLFEQELRTGSMPSASGIIAASREKPKNVVDDGALWLWGRLQDFQREHHLLDRDPNTVVDGMLPHMQETVRELAPKIAEWLGRIK